MTAPTTSLAAARRPHALLIPFPCSGFINPALHFARLLHSAGFVVTFVNTEHNHALMLARWLDDVAHGGDRDGDGFRYEAIPDGLSPDLIARLNTGRGVADDSPPAVTCVVASELMSFALDVAAELGVAAYTLWGTSACGLACGLAVRELRHRGYVPLKVSRCRDIRRIEFVSICK
ncbi:hypothetical protein E2562_019063 [Oryza meyeriana var. granulata]|uniref:Uncharacterized protein n=1 Tax=Oryza meyeriana var. granulata TaxID=110450 RepID=A0A6G1CRF1_9ORYZ|nr:hypothetical protein E2562_019063 [Oryza meyeriana var. granulata]